MKKSLLALCVAVVGLTTGIEAQNSTSYASRKTDVGANVAEQGAYTYMRNVNLASTDWTLPSKAYVVCVEVKSSGTLKVVSRGMDTTELYCVAGDVKNINIIRIFKTGTTADSIVVLGYNK